jgi:hypothetical protein
MVIKAVPYIKTFGTEKFKQFLTTPFNGDLLVTLFKGWKKKDLKNIIRYEYDYENVIIEFINEMEYQIRCRNKFYKLMIPETIDVFICDMNRLEIDIFWDESIDVKFEPIDYLEKNEIKNYYWELLEKMGKSHELLI